MIGKYSARLSGSKRNLIALLASSAVLTAGCSNMVSTAPSAAPLSSPASLSGQVHGGNQQVVGATVTLWYAGQGAPATLAATTTTDSGGFFGFNKDTVNGNPADNGTTDTFSCPESGGSPLVYVMSKGGNTQNNGNPAQSNTAAAFLGIYGDCSELSASNFIFLSEVTTTATMAAVSGFFNPISETITADSTGQEKIVIDEVPATAALLANMTTGLYVPSTPMIPPLSGANVAAGVTVTATPEAGKVNLIANIISACVNSATSSSTQCGTLFASAVPPIPNTTFVNPESFPAATDTLQALYYLFTNPSNGQGTTGTNNLSALFSLAGGLGAPYQPSAAQPTDWTIAITYASNGTCGTTTGGTGGFINSPVDMGIDGSDSVWFANSQAGGNLSAITSSGQPLACVNLDAGSSNAGGVLDSSGNIWFAGATTMHRYNQTSRQTFSFPTGGVTPLAIAADGLGNVYFTGVSGAVGSLYQLPGAATATSATDPIQISNTVGPNPARIMPDFKSLTVLGNIWVSSGSTFISQVAATTASPGPGILNGFITTPIPAFSTGSSYGVTVDQDNAIVASTMDTNEVNTLVFNGDTYVTLGNGWPFSAPTAGIANPTGISVDGRGNVFLPNGGNSSFSELSLFGANPLSPATGFQKASSVLKSNRVSMVDQAGNVWIVGSGNNNFVTEILGNAVQIFQPYAVGLANGRFQQIP
ncbi:MAG: hypothetical protein ABSA39_20565 [Edaphobacter sp.]